MSRRRWYYRKSGFITQGQALVFGGYLDTLVVCSLVLRFDQFSRARELSWVPDKVAQDV